MTAILGISAFYHDAAAALVVDGRVVAAAQEERFSRKKHDEEFPRRAIDYCLAEAGLGPADLDHVAFYDKPLLKFDRLLETHVDYAPRGLEAFEESISVWLGKKLHLRREMDAGLRGEYARPYVFLHHHESHAASAFFPSPFEEAAILTLDGVGEWATGTLGTGLGNRITLRREMHFPHSLGLLYAAFTHLTGFQVNSDEYKMMGLAPYGEPRFVDEILGRIVDLKADGSFRMDMSYFGFCDGRSMTSPRLHELFGPPRAKDAPIGEREMDLAASIQRVTEEIVLRSARHLREETGLRDLCLAGGVALNCVANGRLLREGPFERIWIQPAADDAGGALGAALFVWHQLLEEPRLPKAEKPLAKTLLGPAYDDATIGRFLDGVGARYEKLPDDRALCERVAAHLDARKVVGWFQGRMEFGPRALGARSILADPRDPDAQGRINRKVKFREGFRPFAPSVLREKAGEYFELPEDADSPYMLLVAQVARSQRRELSAEEEGARGFEKLRVARSTLPSVTHVDGSARVQTVDAGDGVYRLLLEAFHRRTGCPVLVNTSFNLGWEPIVCTPEDAYRTFMSSDLDVLCMGRYLVEKARLPSYVREEARDDLAAVLGDVCRCPACGGELAWRAESVACGRCAKTFEIAGGLPLLFEPEDLGAGDVTGDVRSFYEATPFPDYDEHDSLRSLLEKSRRGVYARRLEEAIPFDSTVLEVGCGTGQLSNFLGASFRRVVGTDLSVGSLRLGEAFRRENQLARVRFLQMNLFRPCLAPGSFDVLLCNGVLHHTSEPFRGFETLLPLVRPGGHVVIGLYNRYGRLATDLRRMLFRATGGRGTWLDPHLRSLPLGERKRGAWYADQYRHPHESKHTMGEVLGWFERTGVEFVRGVPVTRGLDDGGGLFEPMDPGSRFDRALAQAKLTVTGNREGGFFVMIGRRAERAGP